MPPALCKLGRSYEYTRVGEDVCFWPAPKFGQIMGPNWSEDLFLLIFVLKFSEVPAPPPPLFKILRTLLIVTVTCRPVLPVLIYSTPFVMSQNCEKKGCQ